MAEDIKQDKEITESNIATTKKQLGGFTGKGFMPGQSGNPKGRKKLTKEEKEIKKATKELIKDYTDKLTEALPKISPVLIAKALGGELPAIKEINDRVLGKAKESHDITSGGEPMGVIFLPRRKQDKLEEPNGLETTATPRNSP